jgi:hypothetical protein
MKVATNISTNSMRRLAELDFCSTGVRAWFSYLT